MEKVTFTVHYRRNLTSKQSEVEKLASIKYGLVSISEYDQKKRAEFDLEVEASANKLPELSVEFRTKTRKRDTKF